MENMEYKNVELVGTPTNTEIGEKINEIRVFKEDCNMHLRTLADEFLNLSGLLRVLESVIRADDKTDFSTCEVVKLLKEESDNLQDTVENLMYPTTEEGQPTATEEEILCILKKEYKRFLKTILDDTLELNGVASVLVEAMLEEEEDNKICYILTVKMAVKRLNDIVEKIAFLLKD